MIPIETDPGFYAVIAAIITGILAVASVIITTKVASRGSKQANAVTWAEAMYKRLVALEARVEVLEGVKRRLAGFVDDMGEWVMSGATPPPPFPPSAIHEEIDMSNWKKLPLLVDEK